MPAWNAESFVGEAIQSVIGQTHKRWRLIVVDDGSEDGTRDVVRSFGDSRIQLIQQENRGASAARAAGLAASSTEYVYFLDSDDKLRPDALKRTTRALEEHPEFCAAYGDAVFTDAAGRNIGSEAKPIYTPRPSGDVLEAILRNNFVFVGTICVRSACIESAGGWKPGMLGEDWDLWCRIAALGHFVYVGEGPVLEYRQHQESTVRRSGTNVDEVFRVIDSVFSSPLIQSRVPARKLRQLRRKREAVIYAFGARYCFSARQWLRAGLYAVRGVWLDLRQPSELILPSILLQAVERRSQR